MIPVLIVAGVIVITIAVVAFAVWLAEEPFPKQQPPPPVYLPERKDSVAEERRRNIKQVWP